ncbi:hypothetical protein Nmel_002524, partial [Mimus melanotis]
MDCERGHGWPHGTCESGTASSHPLTFRRHEEPEREDGNQKKREERERGALFQ